MPPLVIVLIIVCAVLLLLASLLTLPVSVTITAKDRVSLESRYLFLRHKFRLGKQPGKKKKQYKTEKKVTGVDWVDNAIENLSIRDELRLVRGLLARIVRQRRKWLRLRAARIHIRVATGDAATTALLYGTVSQSLSYLLALLGRITNLTAQEPSVAVFPDFLGEKSSADIKIVLSCRMLDVIKAHLHVVRADKLDKKKQNESILSQNTVANQKGI